MDEQNLSRRRHLQSYHKTQVGKQTQSAQALEDKCHTTTTLESKTLKQATEPPIPATIAGKTRVGMVAPKRASTQCPGGSSQEPTGSQESKSPRPTVLLHLRSVDGESIQEELAMRAADDGGHSGDLFWLVLRITSEAGQISSSQDRPQEAQIAQFIHQAVQEWKGSKKKKTNTNQTDVSPDDHRGTMDRSIKDNPSVNQPKLNPGP